MYSVILWFWLVVVSDADGLQGCEEIPEEGQPSSEAGKSGITTYGEDVALMRRLQFAKHFKLEEQVSFLQKHRTGIAVGTPQRLTDLIENGT